MELNVCVQLRWVAPQWLAPQMQPPVNAGHLLPIRRLIGILSGQPKALRQQDQQQKSRENLGMAKTLTRKKFVHWANKCFTMSRN
jgi:hypothetical protein